jgi:signal transduction histidine kinase
MRPTYPGRAWIERPRAAVLAGTAAVARASRRILGVRLRSALAAATVVAVAFIAGAGVFLWQYQRELVANVDNAATDRARDIAADVAATQGSPTGARLAEPSGELSVAEVLDPSGRVIAASPGFRRAPVAFSPLRPHAGEILREDRALVSGKDPYRIVAAGVGTKRGTYTIQVAQSLRGVGGSLDSAVTLVAIGFPILLLVVGTATFVFVGRSLRPVEAIRAWVATISSRALDARVPVPQARDEVARLAETMNAMLDRLEAAATSQRRFIADASHELRSPLATLRAGLELVTPTAENAAVVTTLMEEAERLERLVAGLLILARADDQGLVQHTHDVDLDDLVEAERLRLSAADPRLLVAAEVQPVRIRGDAHQLAQALRNLVDNAARHATTTVTLRVRSEPERAIVEVIDDGPGIPVADRERIFERFVRLDESRSRDDGAGSGLGLAIVSEIVRAHRGRIEVVDSPGGTLMRLELPRSV